MPDPCRPTPEMTKSEPVTESPVQGSAGNSGPVTESPAQEYVLPNHEDGLKPEDSISNQEAAGSEPTAESPAQGHGQPHRQGGLEPDSRVSNQEVTGSEPAAESKAQQPLLPGSQGGQEDSAATMPFHRIIYGVGRVTVPFHSPVPAAVQPVNMMARESTQSFYREGFGEDSRESDSIIGHPDRERAHLPGLGWSLESGWQEGNVAQASHYSAGDPFHGDSQTRAGPQERFSGSFGAPQPVLNQDLRHSAPGTTLDAVSHTRAIFPPDQTNILPIPETSSPNPNQDKRTPPSEVNHLPSIPDSVEIAQALLLAPRRRCSWRGHLPNIYESRRLEERTFGGLPVCLVPGPTGPLGPPLKPLDGPRVEANAQEQWRIVMVETERREIRESGGVW